MKWEFTPDEFMHIWAETGQDRYPFPLRLIASVRWEDEYDRIARELSRRLPLAGDPDLSAVLRVAANPETSLALTGIRRRPMRAYGAIDTNVGVALVQRPGPTTEFGGNVVIEVGSPAIVPKVFAAVAGNVAPGRQPAVVEDYDRMREQAESWPGTNDTATDRIRNLFEAPQSGSGLVEVLRGRHSDRPFPPIYFRWFDIDGDGRYAYRRQYNDFRVAPCSQEMLQQEIARLAQPVRAD
ncbi:ESX secretion-associated protein EspG [Nocardia sp. NPDC051570]|uniref:ESX secretion-associated protein EspG n=1 Tax=Nocardia sp. NPDC051570 TaxID=3364324 RepID=UPI00379AD167